MKIKVETDTDATTPFYGIWNGVDLTKNSTAYDPKLWDNNVAYNEGVMIHKDRTTVQLLYPIKDVVSVRSYDLQTVYYPGKDYVVTTDGKLKILDNSNIPVYQEVEKLYERSTGYFDLRKLDGTRIHSSAGYKKLRLLETRKGYLTERRMAISPTA